MTDEKFLWAYEEFRKTVFSVIYGYVRNAEDAAELSQCPQLLCREESLSREDAVDQRRDMPLREDEPVPVLPVRVLRVHIHVSAKIQTDQEICC